MTTSLSNRIYSWFIDKALVLFLVITFILINYDIYSLSGIIGRSAATIFLSYSSILYSALIKDSFEFLFQIILLSIIIDRTLTLITETIWGGSLGKILMESRVCRVKNEKKIDFTLSFIKQILYVAIFYILFSLLIYYDFKLIYSILIPNIILVLPSFLFKNKQTLYELICGLRTVEATPDLKKTFFSGMKIKIPRFKWITKRKNIFPNVSIGIKRIISVLIILYTFLPFQGKGFYNIILKIDSWGYIISDKITDEGYFNITYLPNVPIRLITSLLLGIAILWIIEGFNNKDK